MPETAKVVPEGYATLAVIEHGAPNYNAWLGRRLLPHLGKRVLEVGAGIGTITREILPGRDLVIALEAEAMYAERLAEAFKDEPRVKTVHCAVEETDWTALAAEGLDSVLLSNVLEHIEDDGAAIANLRKTLHTGGKLVLLVPALPWLFGSMDEAVGHHRRYLPRTLRNVIEENGFKVERLEWMNLLGIPGWFLNSRILQRRVLPAAQVRAYDRIAPLLARVEAIFRLPVGLSLLAVGRAV
jgi:SAM-dependent methyltransferase